MAIFAGNSTLSNPSLVEKSKNKRDYRAAIKQ
jgi:hypothetical protein